MTWFLGEENTVYYVHVCIRKYFCGNRLARLIIASTELFCISGFKGCF